MEGGAGPLRTPPGWPERRRVGLQATRHAALRCGIRRVARGLLRNQVTMSLPRSLFVALFLLAACTRAVREPVPAEAPAPQPPPPAAAAAAEPEPEAESEVEKAREAEEAVEVVDVPPPAVATAGGSPLEVQFDLGGAALTTAARSLLDRMGAGLADGEAGYYLEIQGHTDPSGGDGVNRRLAEQRAEAVRRYLHARHGVPLAAMGVVSLGAAAPAADNGTAEGRQRNRRAVVVLLPAP